MLSILAIPLGMLAIFNVLMFRQARPVWLEPVPGGPSGSVRVWAKVRGPSMSWWFGHIGRLTLEPTELVWTAESGQCWRTPYRDVVVREVYGVGVMSNAPIELQVGDGGVWKLRVCDRPIGGLKGFRLAMRHGVVAGQVCDLLVSHGAHRA